MRKIKRGETAAFKRRVIEVVVPGLVPENSEEECIVFVKSLDAGQRFNLSSRSKKDQEIDPIFHTLAVTVLDEDGEELMSALDWREWSTNEHVPHDRFLELAGKAMDATGSATRAQKK